MCDLAVDLDAEVRSVERSAAQVCATPFRAMPLGDMQPPIGFADELAAIDKLSGMGMVQRDDRRIYVSEAGRPFIRLVAAAFDTICRKIGSGTR